MSIQTSSFIRMQFSGIWKVAKFSKSCLGLKNSKKKAIHNFDKHIGRKL